MKYYILILASVLLSTACAAQQPEPDKWDFGGQASIHSTVTKHLESSENPWFQDNTGILGFGFGLIARRNFSERVKLKTGLQIIQFGDRYGLPNSSRQEVNNQIHLQLPVEIQYFLSKRLYLNAGVESSVSLYERNTFLAKDPEGWVETDYIHYNNAFEMFQTGIVAGAGWEFPVGKEKQSSLFVQPTVRCGIWNTNGGFWAWPLTAGVTGGFWL